MAFSLFKKKDPVCGMKQENGKGTEKHGEWFCSPVCLKQFEEKKTSSKPSCCK